MQRAEPLVGWCAAAPGVLLAASPGILASQAGTKAPGDPADSVHCPQAEPLFSGWQVGGRRRPASHVTSWDLSQQQDLGQAPPSAGS